MRVYSTFTWIGFDASKENWIWWVDYSSWYREWGGVVRWKLIARCRVCEGVDWIWCVSAAYCIWRVVSPIFSLKQLSSSLRLFCHVPLKRDPLDWDWGIWLNDTPHAIGCNIWPTNCNIWLTNLRVEDLIEWHSACNTLYFTFTYIWFDVFEIDWIWWVD